MRKVLFSSLLSVGFCLAGASQAKAPDARQPVYAVTQSQLASSLQQQIENAGLTPQPMDLFPESNSFARTTPGHVSGDPDWEEGKFQPPLNNDPGFIRGIQSNGQTFADFQLQLNSGIYESSSLIKIDSAPCQTNAVVVHKNEFRTFIALHEPTHSVSIALKLGSLALAELQQAHPRDHYIVANIEERIADTSAILYLLANSPNRANAFKLGQIVKDWRSATQDVAHYSVDSVDLALRLAPTLSPMTIIETAKLAEKLVGSGSFTEAMDENRRAAAAEIRFGVVRHRPGISQADYDQELGMRNEAIAARERLCSLKY